MMDKLPSELISHILRFLSVSDRKEAALVCRAWYNASLHPVLQRDIIVMCKPLEKGCLPPLGLISRKLTRLEFGDWDSQQMSETTLLDLLSKCPSLIELDLSHCDKLFLSGRLLEKDIDRNILRQTLGNVRKLKLSCLRFMTDITFSRLVSVLENLESISLSSTNVIFSSGLCDPGKSSSVIVQFSTFLKFVQEQALKLKYIDLSFTAVHDEALNSLAKVKGLTLQEIRLQGCMELSDKGLKMLATHQHSIEMIDLTGCRELGNSMAFFSTLASNLPQLHTLIVRKCAKLGQCDIQSLADFKALRTLDMGEVLNLLDKDLIKALCCQGPRLTGLYLSCCSDIHDDFVFELCKSNYTLTDLDLSSCLKLTDASLHVITKKLTSLRTLRLPYCRDISDIGILGYTPENGVLPSFSFDFDHDGCPCTRERDSKIFRKPSGVIKEHKSCLSKAHITVENGGDVHMLSNLKSLQVLDLSSCHRITDFALAEAIRFKGLRTLYLNGTPKLRDTAVISIARHNPSLEEVYISAGALITDVSVAKLVEHCQRLHTLDISQCGMLSDACLEVIAAKGKRLRYLDISFNNLSVQAVATLEKKMKIVFRPHIY